MHLPKGYTLHVFNLLNWAPVLPLISPSESCLLHFQGEREEKVKVQYKRTARVQDLTTDVELELRTIIFLFVVLSVSFWDASVM